MISRLAILLCALAIACGSSNETPAPTPSPTEESPSTMGTSASAMAEAPANPPVDPMALPDELPNGLLVGYSPFAQNEGGQWVQPAPARLEMITRRGGEWHVDAITDSDSNVFHKAMPFTLPGGEQAILTIGGMGAHVKLWRHGESGWTASNVWSESFGGRFDRMRDVEIGDLFGDQRPALAIATHDQGVVAFARLGEDGQWAVQQTPKRRDIFVHEIELGDLDGDGTLEVYATPSEPNHTRGGGQAGEVVRYVPKNGVESTVVANLGNRHAKEIFVGDVDGDGRDELYVAVEGLTERGDDGSLRVVESVEIRRYDADTPADQGVVVATIEGDHLTRFLTVGDVDGDGKKEMVIASFSQGLWLARPGANPRAAWSVESIDRDSGGFEHASILADLDGNGTDELYVASDNDGELRRYVWVNGRARRQTMTTREQPRSMITWNIVSAPSALLRGE
ncbi:MAG: VCBS repeat-containing protein [Sandaracinus sp.]|nr:VCBS repeat-containing protein [Sandaracinus sp.]MCB9631130.1 VCBS repeat-containing protein [Sandaracinus sp.]